MWKYRSQTLISVLGLAVGFTCFALATLWIVYEMTFDTFHKNAKQMYVVYKPSNDQTGYSNSTPNPLAVYLKETFPEIAKATSFKHRTNSTFFVEGSHIRADLISADSSFLRMFDIKVLEGSYEFLVRKSNKIAITPEKARQLFGDDHPIGKIILGNIEICALVSGMSNKSNFSFDFIEPVFVWEDSPWISGYITILELHPGTNLETFEKKLYAHETGEGRGNLSKMTIKSLTKLHYTDPERELMRAVKYRHIVIFALSGFLVILCSLFNYLTLFVSRFRIRQKELALRVVCGASGGSLLKMLTVEFLLTLLFAVGFGCLFAQWLYPSFLALSEISLDLSAIYRESVIYIGVIIMASLLVFWLILYVFRKRSLNLSIRSSNKKLFRKSSVVIQLVISICFAFCVIIILKQMYFLHHSGEIGFSFKNSCSILAYGEKHEELVFRLKQIPEIKEVVDAKSMHPLLPKDRSSPKEVNLWDDQPADGGKISIEEIHITPEYASFYDLRVVAGEMLTDADPESMVMLNEAAVQAFGWYDPIGKRFAGKYTVKGVIKNVCNSAPTIPVKPTFYSKLPVTDQKLIMITESNTKRTLNADGTVTVDTIPSTTEQEGRYVLFHYHEGLWTSCKEKLNQMKKEYETFTIHHAETIYDHYLTSERNLIKLLSFVSVICVLICVFGFVALVSLTCEERRKAVALRKINGATVGTILAMFTKEYALLLLIGAAIAFPTAFFIMQRWLEQFVKQTSIAIWVYLSILFVLALVIALCVGWQVYKTSVENPAEVINK